MPEKRKPAIRNYPKHFRSDASELNYINDQVEKALYLNQDPTSAQAYLPRLDELLSKRDWEDGSIMLQAFRALRNEIVGDLESAIPHRELEVEYIEKVWALGIYGEFMDHRFLLHVFERLVYLCESVGDQKRCVHWGQRVSNVLKDHPSLRKAEPRESGSRGTTKDPKRVSKKKLK